MAKRNTRHSISVKGLTYQRMKDYCEKKDRSISGYLEEIIAKDMTARGVPEQTVLRPRPTKPKEEVDEEDIISNHFTF